ncbi:hypothetical protein PC114_g3563 [Phytophthora cactorum]|nr:hypothetical protein PC114_g3563 [Phytophthora cactorum]
MVVSTDLALSAWRTTTIRPKKRKPDSEVKQRQLRALIAKQSMLIRSMNELL